MQLTLHVVVSALLIYYAIACEPNEDDNYLVSAILENSLASDCVTLRKLAGVFFASQERPPHSVRITYSLCIPYNRDCDSCEHNCWSEGVCGNTTLCPSGYCYVQREFLWGRIPLIVQDNIYRTLNICPFMIGGNTEKKIEINFTFTAPEEEEGGDQINCVTTKQFPCNWCMGDSHYRWHYDPGLNTIDDIATIARYYSALDKALLTLTEKLQGYAVKAQALPWLRYSSDLAIGYAAPYPVLTNSPQTLVRYIGFFISYVSFQLILFMLIYKYRYRLYRRLYAYVNSDPINSAFFYSFITTTILTSFGMLIAANSGGYCLSLFQIVLLGIALLFSVPHGIITCFRLKKRSDFFATYLFFCCCLRLKWVNIITQMLVFWLLYSMPHVIMYLSMIFSLNLFYSPFSYMIILMYLGLSIIILWIGNAIVFHLMSVSAFRSSSRTCNIFRNRGERRRLIFAIFIAIAVNVLYFTAWGFVQTFFYDKRGSATNYLTFAPGFAITLVGWYLSGDLVKVFDMFTSSKTEDEVTPTNDNEKKGVIDDDDDPESLETIHIIQQKGDQQARYSVKRLKWIMRAVRRPPSLTFNDSTDESLI